MVELELQAVVWAIRKCHIYLQGLPRFDVVVDHKPLEFILNNQTMDMIDNPRIQRLKEKVSGYTFQTILKKKKKTTSSRMRSPEPRVVILHKKTSSQMRTQIPSRGAIVPSFAKKNSL